MQRKKLIIKAYYVWSTIKLTSNESNCKYILATKILFNVLIFKLWYNYLLFTIKKREIDTVAYYYYILITSDVYCIISAKRKTNLLRIWLTHYVFVISEQTIWQMFKTKLQKNHHKLFCKFIWKIATYIIQTTHFI